MHLEYVGIRVTDFDRSLRFYTEQLGLKELRRKDARADGLGIWVVLQDAASGQQIELNWYPEGSRHGVPYVAGEGLDHLGFVVDDVAEAYERLVAAGAEPAMPPAEYEGLTACVKDPDGNWIEVYQKTPPKTRPR
jgi:lactoylglutathione lyase